MSALRTEHRPGLRTDRCRLCARNQRRGLTLCHGCPDARRVVHLPVHACPPAPAVPPGQREMFGSTERTRP